MKIMLQCFKYLLKMGKGFFFHKRKFTLDKVKNDSRRLQNRLKLLTDNNMKINTK